MVGAHLLKSDTTGQSVHAGGRAAQRTAYLSRMHACTEDTPGFDAMLMLSPLGLANLKMGQGFRQPGSSPFTSVDRRFPGLPGANTQGGIEVRRGG